MDRLLPSLRCTLRLLFKSPGFSFTAALILGFGIGVNTAIFSLIDNVLLKPLPFPNPDRLVQINEPYLKDTGSNVDYPDFIDIVRSQHTFDAIAVASYEGINLSGDGKPEQLTVEFVSPSVFQVTGSPVVVGRVFTDQEDVRYGPLLVVLSEKCWRGRFHSDPNILGSNLTLGEHSFQVIGVVPRQATDWGPPGVDFYSPANTEAALGRMPNQRGYPLDLRDVHRFACYGRLKPGVTVAQAQADLEIIHNNLMASYPDTNQGYDIRVAPLLDRMVVDYAGTTWLMAAAVGCLLLIAAGNVANLLFARGLQRRRELMVRSVLGASRLQLVGQLLRETLFLSGFGGFIGLLFSFYAIDTIKKLVPVSLYRFQELRVDWHALLFVLVVTMLGLCAFVVTLFSGTALSLSAVGLYGILAYSVGQRTREIGIRIALGARGNNVIKLVAQRGFKIVGIGLVVGITVSLVTAHVIQGLLYGVSPIDPISFGVSLLCLGIVATLACLLPALRAIRINPITALRE